MSRDASSTAINESYENIRHRQETPPDLSGPEELLLPPEDLRILDAIQRRVLWLCTFTIHHANHVRPNTEDLKVAGHQASSASMLSILTALYFRYLQAGDRVSIKPHASPAYHAIQYLLGNLDQQYLPTPYAHSMAFRPTPAGQKILIQLILVQAPLVWEPLLAPLPLFSRVGTQPAPANSGRTLFRCV